MPGSNVTNGCPYLARYRPSGREHTYDLCEATGEAPLIPTQSELAELCHGEFPRCPHFQAARGLEADPARRAG